MQVLPHFATVGPNDAPNTALLLHGILGSHRNWRSFARRLATALPDWRFVLVDQRCHGNSTHLSGPHTVASCAEDLVRLEEHLGCSVQAVIGHSFGGKVALEWSIKPRSQRATVIVLDSPAGGTAARVQSSLARGSDTAKEPLDTDTSAVERVIQAVRTVPMPVTDRRDVADFLHAKGFSGGLASWMTSNLRREGKILVWSFDLDGVIELLQDYRQLDYWDIVQAPPQDVDLVQIWAENSDRWLPSDRAQLAEIDHPRSRVYRLKDAGHWLHVDNAAGLLALLVPVLRTDGRC